MKPGWAPCPKEEPQPWKPQQLKEENRGESLQECRSSQRMQPSEESWQQEIRRLKGLLVGKDQQISRVEQERRTLAEDHADTLALLSSTQAALKQAEENGPVSKNNAARSWLIRS
ncbi:hypothetical protein D4764_14G0000530 [Takifugu flavidus]|uniref:Uncharacterized protein n=1 Tax=Takifugu flavidus TaxID=433684 RepID=A0A5C6P2P0_9TELE|nr:hypothetical protein D4764_14G0000530 [Takifugu flavidus]